MPGMFSPPVVMSGAWFWSIAALVFTSVLPFALGISDHSSQPELPGLVPVSDTITRDLLKRQLEYY